MSEAIKELFNSPEMTSLITAAISYLSANLVAIIMFAVKYIKLKKTEISDKLQHKQVVEALEAEFQAKTTAINDAIDRKLDRIERAIQDKLEELDEEQQRQIEAESVNLESTIAEIKNSLNTD